MPMMPALITVQSFSLSWSLPSGQIPCSRMVVAQRGLELPPNPHRQQRGSGGDSNTTLTP